ncbi:MAG TPA: ABC transporter substrate-binding protein [Candidatus Methylomirabilis sp.]|nr:ABC transporter substrate-binding protein [Candidatus Methylomirabilis sp.]
MALALSILAAPFAVKGQQTAKIPRIGVLRPGSPMGNPDAYQEAFRSGLRDLGYIEGQTILLEPRWGEGRLERLPGLVTELIDRKVDIIVVGSGVAAQVAHQATSTIPIVMATGDPVASGLVSNLARPGGNITGLSGFDTELSEKRLQLLKETSPGVSGVAVVWNPSYTSMLVQFTGLQTAAPSVGASIRSVEVRDAKEFERAFAAMTRDRPDAVLVLADALTLVNRKLLVDFAAEKRLPAIYGSRDFVDSGGLMSYGPNLADMWRRAASYVDRILKGAKPGELPIEQPTKVELVINLKTAKALRLTIPQSVLIRADEVIQ